MTDPDSGDPGRGDDGRRDGGGGDTGDGDAGGGDAGRAAAGMRVRREVLGNAHVDRAVAGTTPFTEPFQDFITRYAWGEVWARPGLDRRMRSAVTLGVLTALHCRGELAMHVRAARRNGLTEGEIAEILLHTSLYAGLPAANEAFATAREVLARVDDEGPSGGAGRT